MYATYMYTSWDTCNVTYHNSSCTASVSVIIQANLISLAVWRHSFLIKTIHIIATVWFCFIASTSIHEYVKFIIKTTASVQMCKCHEQWMSGSKGYKSLYKTSTEGPNHVMNKSLLHEIYSHNVHISKCYPIWCVHIMNVCDDGSLLYNIY